MKIIDRLISPAIDIAMITSAASYRNSRFASFSLRGTIRFWVSAEWRKTTCGMTVAPRMPTASRMLFEPSWGTIAW